ncbi:MAG: putative transposase [uncultured bacterium]|nr:MAG: putative transposase [uncultured bacterium]
MPRRPRITIPGIPVHLIQRGNNRQACFYAGEDYRNFLELLKESAGESECAVHAYVLMTNHVHLLVTPTRKSSAGTLMKRLGQRYVQYINRTYQRSGTLWEGRYRSCIAQQERYLLICQKYIELNPVRAGFVEHPGEYLWSSYRANAQGAESDLLNRHSMYLKLGRTHAARLAAYRVLMRSPLASETADEIRNATNGNYALGDEGFRKEVESILGRRITRGKPGRPRKHPVLGQE